MEHVLLGENVDVELAASVYFLREPEWEWREERKCVTFSEFITPKLSTAFQGRHGHPQFTVVEMKLRG